MIGPARRVRAWREQYSATARDSWRSTDALRRGLVLGAALVVAAVLLHHLAFLLFGAPLLAGSVLALYQGVTGTPSATPRPMPRTVESGHRARLLVDLDPGQGAELVAIRLPDPGDAGPGPVHLLPADAGVLTTRLHWDRWGETIDFRPDLLVAGPDALLVHGPVVGREGRRVVLPAVLPLPPGPLPPRTAGLVGAHRAPRPGDGTELRDIRQFQPGDRLRRVDWRISLRVGARTHPDTGLGDLTTLYIRERHAEADADVIFALDTRADVGPELAGWSEGLVEGVVRPGGSLDTAVTAAASLAAVYLRQGDRVGLVDLGRPQLGLKLGVGRRQLLRLRHQLVTCARSAGWAPRLVLRPEQLPRGALLVLLSAFLDDAVVDRAVAASRWGHLVLAVDVLPEPLVADPETKWGPAVLAILRAEHARRLDALRDQGVQVVRWSAAGAPPNVRLNTRGRPRMRVR
jgi:uncharacterized protein (DUF58 family)